MGEREIPSIWPQVAAGIHNSGRRLVIAATGGGSGAISALLQTPGASRSMLEAVVPYALSALSDFLGNEPEQACSEATARAMAMAAFARARELAPDADVVTVLGIGCTASLATDRQKRGARRIHVAVQSTDSTDVVSAALTDENPTRQNDEITSTSLLLACISRHCNADEHGLWEALSGSTGVSLQCNSAQAGPLKAVFLGERPFFLLQGGDSSTPPDLTPKVVFPGAFNPPHAGHRRMAEIAEQRLGHPVTWELSIVNVDKPPLDYIAVRERLAALGASGDGRAIVVTAAPTFREKAALFPRAVFVVGTDTVARIADARYYGGDVGLRDDAIESIAAQGCRFLVFGRKYQGKFQSASDLNLPRALEEICDEVPAGEFREDISSTELRGDNRD